MDQIAISDVVWKSGFDDDDAGNRPSIDESTSHYLERLHSTKVVGVASGHKVRAAEAWRALKRMVVATYWIAQ